MQQWKSRTSAYSLRLAIVGLWGAIFFCSGLFVVKPHLAHNGARRLGAESLLLSGTGQRLPPLPLFAFAGMHMFSAVALMMSLQGLAGKLARRAR